MATDKSYNTTIKEQLENLSYYLKFFLGEEFDNYDNIERLDDYHSLHKAILKHRTRACAVIVTSVDFDTSNEVIKADVEFVMYPRPSNRHLTAFAGESVGGAPVERRSIWKK